MGNSIKQFYCYTFSAILGLGIIGIFAIFDLLEINSDITLNIFIDHIKQHNTYIFGTIFFPLTAILITYLLMRVKSQHKLLQEQFDFSNTILNASPDAILFLDEKLEINFKNYQFKALFSNGSELLEELKLKSFIQEIKFFQKEYLLTSHIKTNHPFLVSIRLTHHGSKKGFFISLKDLKSVKDKERIIEDQKNLMIEKNKLASLGEMAAGIAHEVNNPLTVINSNNFLIQKIIAKPDLNKEKLIKLTDKNLTQVKRITEIISSLRNLSRGMSNLEPELFSFNQLIQEAFNLAQIKDTEKKIKFSYRLKKDYLIHGNRGQIVQVVLNLFNNSIDAIQDMDEPWIKVEAHQSDDYINFHFIDSGPGIPHELVNKIFQPMFTTKEVGKGTGLGLSLSTSYIENNNGFLFYDQTSQNTCFIISLKESSQKKPLLQD